MKNIYNKIIRYILLFIMIVVIIGSLFILFDFFKNNRSSSNSNNEILFLMAGVDSTGEETGTRTDTLMLIKADKKDKDIDIISIPRDSYVDINGSMDKINAAHSYGGMDLTIDTIRNFLGINLDYYVVINFDAVKNAVDYLGGIDIDVSPEVAEAMDINSGINHFNGVEALNYVRFRKGYTNADLGRIDTQQDFMKQFIKEITKAKNIVKMPLLYLNIKSDIKTNIPIVELMSLMWNFKSLDTSKIETTRLTGEVMDIDGISYYYVYPDFIAEIRENILYNFIR